MELYKRINDNKDKIATVTISYIRKAKRKRGREGGDAVGCWICVLERERVLLSKIPANPIFGFLRSKKESRSTRRGQCVGIGFLKFRQTP